MTLRSAAAAVVCLAACWIFGNCGPVPEGYSAAVLDGARRVGMPADGHVLTWPAPLRQVAFVPDGARDMLETPDGAALDVACTVTTADGQARRVSASLRWRGGGDAAVPRALLMAAMLDQAARSTSAKLSAGTAAFEKTLRDAVQIRFRQSGGRLIVTDLAMTVTPAPDAARAQDSNPVIAAARADAAAAWQRSDAARGKILADAAARAAERVGFARRITATLAALDTHTSAATRAAVSADLYRDRISEILRKAGSVSTVDPRSISRLILPDPSP